MFVDRFYEQALDLRQVKDLFGKGVKLSACQQLRQRDNAFHIRTADDQVVCAFGSVAALIVGNAVFQTLLLVLLLCKLLLNFFFLGIQLGNGFLFGIV